MNEQFPLSRKVINVISYRISIEPDGITRDSSFIKDLKADSLDIAELMMDLEDAFGIKFPWHADIGGDEAFQTVGNVISYIEKEMAKK